MINLLILLDICGKDLSPFNSAISFLVRIVIFDFSFLGVSIWAVFEILSRLSFIFSIIIVVTNILGIALVAYSSDYEGIVQIKGNIFTWFTNLDTSSVDLYTSRGLFYSTNQMSAILGALLFVSIFYAIILLIFL